MKSDARLLLTDGAGHFIVEDHRGVQTETTDFYAATNYARTIDRFFAAKPASKKFGKTYTFKNYIGLSGNIDWSEQLKIESDDATELTKMDKLVPLLAL